MLGAGPAEMEQDSVGLLGTETFQPVANQGREGMQRFGRSSQETTMQTWGSVLVPPQGIYIVSLSSFTELKPTTNGNSELHSREGHSLITLRSSSGDYLRPD